MAKLVPGLILDFLTLGQIVSHTVISWKNKLSENEEQLRSNNGHHSVVTSPVVKNSSMLVVLCSVKRCEIWNSC